MTNLHGQSLVAGAASTNRQANSFRATNPAEGRELETDFYEATPTQIDAALNAASGAYHIYRKKSADEIADFLQAIAREIETLGEALIERANQETALPVERLRGERARTINQLMMFADLVREGSWVEASIDHAQPERKPLPKPDLRRMLVPLGPVIVFGASNFPLAFSVAGGDTASALAAGNPVIVKAHPAHPGTSEIIAEAVLRAARASNMPAGVFSLLQGATPQTSLALVEHPLAKAVGFTGSLRVGRSLFDAAARRPEPIPVYAEMGSTNPVFVLPGALSERGDQFAEALKQSVTLGVGQFCTNPGLVVGFGESAMGDLVERMNALMQQVPPATMLNANVLRGYEDGLKRLREVENVRASAPESAADETLTQAAAFVFSTDAATFLAHEQLGEEVFGPSTLIVNCRDQAELRRVAEAMHGHLTATIHGTDDDLREFAWLVDLLQDKVGRLVYNGFPTGVEVCASMQHGGPYPATTDSRSTSVGTAAIKRFARPVSYQNFPQDALPVELRDANPRGIWRLVDNEWNKSSDK